MSRAERDARRHADRERIEQAARALLTTERWQRWVRVRATNGLPRYSLRNQWLIAVECHNRGITPSYVAGFRACLALSRGRPRVGLDRAPRDVLARPRSQGLAASPSVELE